MTCELCFTQERVQKVAMGVGLGLEMLLYATLPRALQITVEFCFRMGKKGKEEGVRAQLTASAPATTAPMSVLGLA